MKKADFQELMKSVKEGALILKGKAGYGKAPRGVAKAIKKAHVVKDFLPRPKKLVLKK